MEQKDRVLLEGSRNKHMDTDAELSLTGMCLSYFFFPSGAMGDPITADLPWRDCRSIYSSHTWGLQAHRIRLTAVISTEGIKNKQAEECVEETITIREKKKGKVI